MPETDGQQPFLRFGARLLRLCRGAWGSNLRGQSGLAQGLVHSFTQGLSESLITLLGPPPLEAGPALCTGDFFPMPTAGEALVSPRVSSYSVQGSVKGTGKGVHNSDEISRGAMQ